MSRTLQVSSWQRKRDGLGMIGSSSDPGLYGYSGGQGQVQAFAGNGASDTTPQRYPRTVGRAMGVLEHAQDVITAAVGAILLLLAATLLGSGLVNFASNMSGSIANSAKNLLDQVLFVLILVEIVHTVVLSLRTHRLVAQPFIIVGLVAVIRRILFLLSTTRLINATELALLIAMVVAFVASLIVIGRFGEESRSEEI